MLIPNAIHAIGARRRCLRAELSKWQLELLDSSYLCRLYIYEARFVFAWPTLADLVRRMCEMRWLHEWTSYHARIREVEAAHPRALPSALWRMAEARTVEAAGGWPDEWPWLRRTRLLLKAVARLRIRCWLARWTPSWLERFYHPDTGRFVSLRARRFKAFQSCLGKRGREDAKI